MHTRSRVHAHFSQPSSTQDRRLSHHMPAVEGMQDRGRVKVPHSFAGGWTALWLGSPVQQI
jgi:type VI protein secretion system component VasF